MSKSLISMDVKVGDRNKVVLFVGGPKDGDKVMVREVISQYTTYAKQEKPLTAGTTLSKVLQGNDDLDVAFQIVVYVWKTLSMGESGAAGFYLFQGMTVADGFAALFSKYKPSRPCECDRCGEKDPTMFMLKDEVWALVTKNSRDLICFGCAEAALGRRITRRDLQPNNGITEIMRLGAMIITEF